MGDPFPDIGALLRAFLAEFVREAERDLAVDLARFLRAHAPVYRGHLRASVRFVAAAGENHVSLRFYAPFVWRQRGRRWLDLRILDYQKRRALEVLNRTFRRVEARFNA